MFDKKNLHHAYCIEGEKGAVYEKLCVFFEDELNMAVRGNPDFSYAEFETFSIEEGRNLKENQQNKALDGGKKVFIIAANFITREAQNSLLKIFEEPTEGTHFFLILPSSEILLPTLKSRLEIIFSGTPKGEGQNDAEIKKFITSSKSERLIFLKKIVEEKDKQKAIDFLDRLEAHLGKKTDFTKISSGEVKMFGDIIAMKRCLHQQGASVKMILEHVALSLD